MAENRIKDTGHWILDRIKTCKPAYAQSNNSFCIKHSAIRPERIVIIGLFILSILLFSGCSANNIKTQDGLSDLQMEAYEIIGNSLKSDNPVVRVNAIEVAATTKQLNYMPEIQNMLQDRFVPVRFAAAVAIGEMRYPLALSAINETLNDPDPNVLIAASYAMSRLDDPEYLEVLRQAVIKSANQTTKANAALLLGKSGDRGSIQLLYKLKNSPDSSEMVSYQAVEALAMLGDENVYQTIWTMLISLYADVKIIGVKAMGTLGTPAAESALLTMLNDQVVEIRLATAEQLGKMNNKEGKNVVLEVFKNKLYMTQNMQDRERILTLAALAIGEIGTKDLTKFLPDLMKSESPFIRLAAAKAVLVSSRKL